jgi:hypothetical protein
MQATLGAHLAEAAPNAKNMAGSTAGEETVSDLGSDEGMARIRGYIPWRMHGGRLIFPDFLLRQNFL